MGTRRANEQQNAHKQQPHPQGVAALAVLITSSVPAGEVADGILALLPALLRSSPEALKAAQRVAGVVMEGKDGRPRLSLLADLYAREDALHRAMYAVNSAARLAEGISDAQEERYLAQHLAASQTRERAYRSAEPLVKRWGYVLGWNHLNRTRTHRPSHVRANGQNFDVRRPPVVTGGLPGTLRFCDCEPTAPYRAARTLR